MTCLGGALVGERTGSITGSGPLTTPRCLNRRAQPKYTHSATEVKSFKIWETGDGEPASAGSYRTPIIEVHDLFIGHPIALAGAQGAGTLRIPSDECLDQLANCFLHFL